MNIRKRNTSLSAKLSHHRSKPVDSQPFIKGVFDSENSFAANEKSKTDDLQQRKDSRLDGSY
ncbi:hypothetical protein DSCO28_02720 [Desulfosarcina ovata subsp. sediminis]|uniref:Uncharacterized protein n=1 Tax=Desulfosarcina ovata subsp. sediminis TaxID=885957 RepID=A0A5K7ZFG7_9BACT|nr:hypothetical protein [Desulfosarcina ovata]BBO79706.1 hypothetical protein DSCO28_02720 [Desulfosarcina ovata subsp. sediminis]